MKARAIISDIHGNLAAFEAVLADIERVGIREIWCLGDIVGYGPQPLECFRLARERCSVFVMGNHEKAILPGGGKRFNARARRAIEWTRGILEKAPDGEEIFDHITRMEIRHELEDLLFVHGSPADPTEEYLMPRDAPNPKKMTPQFEIIKRVAFVGHTHYPGVIEEGEVFVRPDDMLSNVYMLDMDVKAIINVGSVGQPRDRDPRACYVTFDGDSVVYRRVEYDAEGTRKRIHAIGMLDNFLGDRLLEGR